MNEVCKPLVSIVVLTYNHEKFIRQCLEGILMQKTTFFYEVIVGEDCSTDNTRAIIKEYETRFPEIIKPIYHERNVGVLKNAYEYCYARIKGKYVAICEGDDYWTDPEKIQKQVDFLENNPDYSLCFHNVNRVNEHDAYIEINKPTDIINYYSWRELIHLNIPTLSLVFRNCFSHIPSDILTVKSADVFLRGMLAKFGGAADLGFIGGNYRKHPGGIYSSIKEIEKFKCSLQSRKVMFKSSYFNAEQKNEIRKEFLRRKILYAIYFLRKLQLKNCFKIAVA